MSMENLLIPEGWSSEESAADLQCLESSELFSEFPKLVCGNRLKIVNALEYTNPNNDYTVPRSISFEALSNINFKLVLCIGIPFPRETRIARWQPYPTTSNPIAKKISVKSGAVWTEVIPEQFWRKGFNTVIKCG